MTQSQAEKESLLKPDIPIHLEPLDVLVGLQMQIEDMEEEILIAEGNPDVDEEELTALRGDLEFRRRRIELGLKAAPARKAVRKRQTRANLQKEISAKQRGLSALQEELEADIREEILAMQQELKALQEKLETVEEQ